MNNVVIATAGHIDHGKTTLIKALTNIDTDRLKEEKKRGITIELGFAYFDLNENKRVAIVDVPGHEKFIKNMIAGSFGVDIVMMVISAEDGIMPQTTEHLDILELLGVKKGIIVLTKTDLVEPQWIEMIKEDISKSFKDTFLSDAKIIPVSSVNKINFDILKNEIERLSDDIDQNISEGNARLPIDRVFSITGHGTIVTGTLIEGKISKGETLELYTSRKDVKIRNIEVHGENVDEAYKGQRVALNLANIKKDDVKRGFVIASKDSMKITDILDVKIKILKSTKRVIKNWQRVRVLIGTDEIIARLVLLGDEKLSGGDEAYCQLRLDESIACKYKDKFILRFYSPLETIGGGYVLDSDSHKKKRFKDSVLKELQNKENQLDFLENIVLTNSNKFLTKNEYINISGLSEGDDVMKSLINDGIIENITDNILVHNEYIKELEEKIKEELNIYHDKFPFRNGMSKQEIKNKFFKDIKNKVFDDIILYFNNKENKNFVFENNIVHLYDFHINYSKKDKLIIKEIVEKIESDGYKPRFIRELLSPYNNVKHINDIVMNIINDGLLIKVSEDFLISKKVMDDIKITLMKEFDKKEKLSLSEIRDLFDTSRKYIMPIMEYLDSINFTKRNESYRTMVRTS